MAISYYLLQIHPVLLFILMVVFVSGLAALLTMLFRKFVKVEILRSHNEVTGFLFLAIASFYALLLSFVVFVVWDQLNETRANASKEGSSALGLYRDIKFYPDTLESKQLMKVYLDFVYNVIDDEFPNMERMKLSRLTLESFSRVFDKLEHLNPKNQFQVQLVAEMFSHLNELSTFRGLRVTSMETEIPPPIWLPIILGAVITIIFALLLDIEHKRMHIALTTLLGAFIGMILFTIILLDHPFTGSMGIKPKSYMQIFTYEQWANEHLELSNQVKTDTILEQGLQNKTDTTITK
ncbi:MAG: DUF4239 domain-containing protein [Ignavibacteria bacterium]|nr:DUF4239 domain-containing protein [Ignavibacteria bacterium]